MNTAEQAQILVGRRISELRSQFHQTQSEMAEELGVSAYYLRNIENGQKNMTIANLAQYADYFGVSVADLFKDPQSLKPSLGRPKKLKSQL